MHQLSDTITRKFIETYTTDEWVVSTDTGYQPIAASNKTIEYEVYDIVLEDNIEISCANTHIFFDEDYSEIYAKDCLNRLIITERGPRKVISVIATSTFENMYDLSIDSTNHRYYTNGILSHNSTSAGGYLLWYAMFIPDSTILIAAHKYTGAQEIMQRIRYAYESVPDHIRAGAVSYNKGSIDFDNGSRIISATTTENTGRGMSISLLYGDEFAFVRSTIGREFWTSISPTLSTGGKCIITSTPNSDEDQFATLWKGANKCVDEFGNATEVGVNGFKAFRSYWREHPDRDENWAIQQRAQLGEERFRREMDGEFIIWDETLISPSHLIEMTGIDPIEQQGQVRWYKKPNPANTYLVALDPSLGTGGDPAAIQIFELPSFIQIGEWQHNRTPIQQQIGILSEINKYLAETVPINNIYYSMENNSIGEAALVTVTSMGEENIKGTFLHEPRKNNNYRKGFNTTNKSKLSACAKLKNLIETKRLTIHSKNLISELKTFVRNGTSFAAKPGETDDLVMSLVLIVRMALLLQNYDASLDNAMRDTLDNFIEPMPFISVLY